MDMQHNYEVSVSWQADRKGNLSSPVLDRSIEVATPPEFPKGMAGIWSPEHLFVAAVNGCLMTTFLSIAENSKLDFVGFNSKAVGTLEKVDGKYMMSKITLMPALTLAGPENREKAERVLQKSEAGCLISNSIKSQIAFIPEITIVKS